LWLSGAKLFHPDRDSPEHYKPAEYRTGGCLSHAKFRHSVDWYIADAEVKGAYGDITALVSQVGCLGPSRQGAKKPRQQWRRLESAFSSHASHCPIASMASRRYLNRRVVTSIHCHLIPRTVDNSKRSICSKTNQSMKESSELFEYTSGRWLFVPPVCNATLFTNFVLELQ
jgi:hypothetical protein